MLITYADILEFLQGEHGFLTKIAKETGLDRQQLSKWRRGLGEPSGDNMIILYEMVKKEMQNRLNGQNESKGPLASAQEAERYIALLEKQADTLNMLSRAHEMVSNTHEVVVKSMVPLLHSISSATAAESNQHTNHPAEKGSRHRKHTSGGLLSSEDSERLAKHLNEPGNNQNEGRQEKLGDENIGLSNRGS